MAASAVWFCSVARLVAQDPPIAPEPAADETAPTPAITESEYGPPLMTPEEKKEWPSQRLKFTSALRVERLSAADRDALTQGARYHLYVLTLLEALGETIEFQNVVRGLLDELHRANLTKKEPRDFLNAEIVRLAPDLLDKAPKSRLNAVLIVASLSSDPAASPPKPYVPGHKLLLNVLNEPTQFVQCKIWAALGLARICRDGDPGVNERNAIAADLIAALDTPQAKLPANWWYRMRLVDALGDSGLVYNLVRKPIVLDALMKIVSDPAEELRIRSGAARAATQLPWEATTNVPLICYQVCRLGKDMAETRNRQLAQNVNNPHWRFYFFNVYMAFVPDAPEEILKRWGLRQQVERPGLGVHKAVVDGAYQALMPVINSVTGSLSPTPTPARDLQNLDNWLQNNVPADFKVTPESEELKQTQQPAPPMAGGQGTTTSWSFRSGLSAAGPVSGLSPLLFRERV